MAGSHALGISTQSGIRTHCWGMRGGSACSLPVDPRLQVHSGEDKACHPTVGNAALRKPVLGRGDRQVLAELRGPVCPVLSQLLWDRSRGGAALCQY